MGSVNRIYRFQTAESIMVPPHPGGLGRAVLQVTWLVKAEKFPLLQTVTPVVRHLPASVSRKIPNSKSRGGGLSACLLLPPSFVNNHR